MPWQGYTTFSTLSYHILIDSQRLKILPIEELKAISYLKRKIKKKKIQSSLKSFKTNIKSINDKVTNFNTF